VSIYLSMQRVRFSSASGYEKFKSIFADVRQHLKSLPALQDWHMNTYHKHAKEWAAQSGAILEDIITNFELASTRLLRICPVCNKLQDKPFDLAKEQQVLAQPCPQCGYHFPVMPEMPSSFAVFKDAV
jgi:hypothetical protein